jgi:hypothetical protein
VVGIKRPGPGLPAPGELRRPGAPEPSRGRALGDGGAVQAPSSNRVDGQGDERRHDPEAEARLLGEGRLGDPTVTSAELASMGALVAARHLMTLLARRRRDVGRAEVVDEAARLLLGLEDPRLARRLLLDMGDAGRIVDVYPLEVLAEVMRRRPDWLEGLRFGPVVENAAELRGRVFGVEERVPLQVPLALRLKAFALEGGGAPGYCLAPGPPGLYHLELGAAGRFCLLLRGEVRREHRVDRVILHVEDAPG